MTRLPTRFSSYHAHPADSNFSTVLATVRCLRVAKSGAYSFMPTVASTVSARLVRSIDIHVRNRQQIYELRLIAIRNSVWQMYGR
eukprot:4560349-Pleurochrysis_carterae.AAC.2